jgi:hypothetical protein
MESVSSSGTWTRREFTRIQRREYRVGRNEPVLLVVLLVYALTFGYLVWCVVTGVAVYAICILIVIPIALWKRTPGLKEERTITVDDTGISVVSNTTSRQEEWARYKTAKERKDYFALQRTDRRPPTIILKRFFDKDSQETRLRALLKAHTNAISNEFQGCIRRRNYLQ